MNNFREKLPKENFQAINQNVGVTCNRMLLDENVTGLLLGN
jgi:hypothetical protein